MIERLTAVLGGRYRVERELGRGGMATVYLAEDRKHGRLVAMKVLRPDIAAYVGAERFIREVEIAARLHHPHIVPLYESGEAEGLLWYSMPFVDGETLRERIAREGRLDAGTAARVLRDVTDALDAAHRRGVFHRDIKPENIMLSGRHALVMDFGVSRAVSAATGAEASGRLTTAGVTLGTPAYMAPEQAAADPAADHRVDVYALGLLGYEMIAGTLPFSGATPQALLAAHLTATPVPLLERCAECPGTLARIIDACIAKDPEDRPALSTIMPALEAVGASAEAPRFRLSGSRLTRRAIGAVLTGLLGAAVVVAAARTDAPGGPADPPPLSTDTAAAHAYRRGSAHLEEWVRAPGLEYGLRAAREEFENAVRIDPRFALAWASLARVRLTQASGVMGYGPGDLAAGKAAADSALMLEPGLPEARAALGRYYYLRGDNAAARREIRRALLERPENPEWLALLGFTEWRTGEWDSAAAHLRAAADVEPRSVRNSELLSRLAIVLVLKRDFESADSIAKRGHELIPDAFWPYYIRARVRLSAHGDTGGARRLVAEGIERAGVIGRQFDTDWQVMSALADSGVLARLDRIPQDEFGTDSGYYHSWRAAMARAMGDLPGAAGHAREAQRHWQERVAANDQDAHSQALLAVAHADAGDTARARQHAHRAVELGELDAVYRPLMRELAAIVCARIGDRACAVQLLSELLQMDSFVTREQLAVDPVWTALRQDPQFQRLASSR